MPRLLPTKPGMTRDASGKGKEPGHRHTALWPKALNLAGKCECWGEGVSLHPLAQDAGGEDFPGCCPPTSGHPSPCASSPAAAEAEREFPDELHCIKALGVQCCQGCQPRWLRFSGRKAGEEPGARFPGDLWEGSITPGQGLNPLQRSSWGKALDAMHVEVDALKPLPAETSSHSRGRERGWA